MESVMKLKTILVLMVVASACLGASAAGPLLHFTQKVTSGDTSCMDSIVTGCSATTIAPCCTAVSDAIDKQRSCFCRLQPALVQEGISSADVAALFTTCGINGSFKTLCPSGGKNAGNKIGTMPLSSLLVLFASAMIIRGI